MPINYGALFVPDSEPRDFARELHDMRKHFYDNPFHVPGWLTELVRQVSYKDWKLSVGEFGAGPVLQICFTAPDTYDPTKNVELISRVLLKGKTEPIVLEEILMAIIRAENHETQELFRYKGKMIFNPHDATKKEGT